jgi:hypothetical protein
MKVVTDLISDTPLPRMVKVRQKFDSACIPYDEIAGAIIAQLSRDEIALKIKPGMTVAITGGSRGINSIALMVKTMADFVRSRDASPFITAAMGSHGGATAEGQLQILTDYGITEETMGCPVKSSMEVVKIGETETGEPVMLDKYAAAADGILLMNRVKPHTSYRGDYESGLMKMMAIGLGKQAGAEAIHGQSPAVMKDLIPMYGKIIMEKANILGGIAVVENAFDKPGVIRGLTPDEIITEEPKLKELSYKTIPQLLFSSCNVLVVDQIGKNISGDGMDPNVTGRFCTPYASGGISAERVVILDLTDETHGNAQGCGLADVVSRRLYEKMKMEMTYPTAITNTFLNLMKIPMVMDSDREAIQLALKSCHEGDRAAPKLIRVKNTAHIEEIEVSEAMILEVMTNPDLELVSEPYEWEFNENGNLW